LLGHTPIPPSLVHIGAVAALRRWGEIHGYLAFLNFLERATDRTESARSVQNGSKEADLRYEVPFGG